MQLRYGEWRASAEALFKDNINYIIGPKLSSNFCPKTTISQLRCEHCTMH